MKQNWKLKLKTNSCIYKPQEKIIVFDNFILV